MGEAFGIRRTQLRGILGFVTPLAAVGEGGGGALEREDVLHL